MHICSSFLDVCLKRVQCCFQQINSGIQGSTFITTNGSVSGGMAEELGTRQRCIVGISYYNEVNTIL